MIFMVKSHRVFLCEVRRFSTKISLEGPQFNLIYVSGCALWDKGLCYWE